MPCMGVRLFDVSGLTGRWKRSRRNGLERSDRIGLRFLPRQLVCNVILPCTRFYKCRGGDEFGNGHHFIRPANDATFRDAGFA